MGSRKGIRIRGMHIVVERFAGLHIEVGFGENQFTMSRGSFKYKQKLQDRKALTKIMDKKQDGERIITFVEEATGKKLVVELREEEGRTHLITQSCEGDWNRFWIRFDAEAGEHIYGCGETYSKFDLRGEKVRIWVAEHQNTSRISKKIIKEKLRGKRPKKTLKFSAYESYYAQPTFVSSNRYYVHVNTNSYAEFDFTKKESITLYLQEKPDIYMESGKDFAEISEKLTSLLGRQRELPDWIYDGGIVAIQEGCEAVDRKIEKALAQGAKINGVWSQDWSGCRRTGFGYQVMWNWTYDKELYLDLPNKIKEWKEKGVHFLGYINPFLAIEKEIYQEASKKGYCVKDKEGKDYLVTITTFPAAMIDFTNPDAYNWYKNLIKENMIGIGMSGWMADFGEYLPIDAVLYSGENAEKIHNQWPAIWAKMNREAIEECGKEKEVFFFTRAGYTETIRHSAMMWTGDQHVDWSVDDGLPAVIPATLSLAMSGYGISHSDVGGYTTIMHMRRSKELLLRWEEMNVFSPLWRSHEGNQPVNNVQFDDDEELMKQLRLCTHLHLELKEYLKACVQEEIEKGTPVMRPLFYHYDEDFCYTEMAEYLLGRDILVAPVLEEGAITRNVTLPNDEWVHLLTGEEYHGGKVLVGAPVGLPPVFIRKSSPYAKQLVERMSAMIK